MKINILLAITFLSFITYANLDYLHGITGMTLRDGGIGCVCHGTEPTISVNVWIAVVECEHTDHLTTTVIAQTLFLSFFEQILDPILAPSITVSFL